MYQFEEPNQSKQFQPKTGIPIPGGRGQCVALVPDIHAIRDPRSYICRRGNPEYYCTTSDMEHVARGINRTRIHGKVGPLMIVKIDHAIDWDPLLIIFLATLFVARLPGI